MSTDNPPAIGRQAYTWCAWLSLGIPALVAALFVALNDPQDREHRWVFPVLFLVFAACFALGGVSLAGIKTNGVWAILPPALLGMLLSAALGLLALIFWGLSGLPRSP